MQRIKINEKDLSKNFLTEAKSTGAVFIPGFANVASDGTGATSAAAVGDCVEVTTLSDFYKKFGTSAPTFIQDQYYPYSGTDGTETRTAKENFTSLEAFNEKYGTVSETKTFAEETSYEKGDRCLQMISANLWGLYQVKDTATTPVKGKWTTVKDSFEVIRQNNDFVTVGLTDPDTSPKTWYRFVIDQRYTVRKAVFQLYSQDGEGFPLVAIPLDNESDKSKYTTTIMFAANSGDPSWLTAQALLSIGMPVVYMRMNETMEEITVAKAYNYLKNTVFKQELVNPILDKGLNIQFLTSGGYPVLEYSTKIDKAMIRLATYTGETTGSEESEIGRGDCVALLDHTNNPHRPLTGTNSIFEHTEEAAISVPESDFAAVFTPWCNVDMTDEIKVAQPSLVYLYTMGKNIRGGANWAIFSGVNRGYCNFITSLNTDEVLTNRVAEYYQNEFATTKAEHASINPITYIRDYGYCIWGNRTCEKYKSSDEGFSLAFLNIRNMLSMIKKQAYTVAQSVMFDTITPALWTDFKLKMSTILDKIQTSGELAGYTFTRIDTGDLTELCAYITLYPTYGLEKVTIGLTLQNQDVATTEEAG